MLLFECQRHCLSWSPLERWLFVDTLDVLRAVGIEGLGGCLKLQCLARAAGGAEGLRAHRALESKRAREQESKIGRDIKRSRTTALLFAA